MGPLEPTLGECLLRTKHTRDVRDMAANVVGNKAGRDAAMEESGRKTYLFETSAERFEWASCRLCTNSNCRLYRPRVEKILAGDWLLLFKIKSRLTLSGKSRPGLSSFVVSTVHHLSWTFLGESCKEPSLKKIKQKNKK